MEKQQSISDTDRDLILEAIKNNLDLVKLQNEKDILSFLVSSADADNITTTSVKELSTVLSLAKHNVYNPLSTLQKKLLIEKISNQKSQIIFKLNVPRLQSLKNTYLKKKNFFLKK